MNKVSTIVLIGLSSVLFFDEARAVDKWSRACRFDTIPSVTKPLAVKFMRLMEPRVTIPDLHFLPTSEQRYWWINESLTTDYFSIRYYLFAEAQVYRKTNGYPTYGTWQSFARFRSQWTAEEVLEAIRVIPDFQPFYANRGPIPWYSARAGHPNLAEYLTTVEGVDQWYRTIGRHAYYDGTLKRTYDMGSTDSTDCNLSQWGQHGLFDR